MDQSSQGASPFGRRTSTNTLPRASIASIPDDYDLSAATVADGFRPTNTVDHSGASASSAQADTNTSSERYSDTSSNGDISAILSSSPPQSSPAQSRLISPGRPSSISKPHRHHDSLTLRNDGSSTSLNAPLLRSESPYHGPSQPSHPYQMYAQRTTSNASSAVAAGAVQRSAAARNQGPTHPYSLYPQSTVPMEDTAEPPTVGFGGMGGPYQRQIGPDGEEVGDLIGPLGHTEQLPPYTKYPSVAHVRPSRPEESPTTTDSPISISTHGAGGLGMATRNPEFSSTESDLALSRSRPSVRSATSENSHSQREANQPDMLITEKTRQSKWQRRAKRRVWGIIPYWVICLLVCGLMLMGVVMGAVIGTMLAKEDDDDSQPEPPKPPPPFATVPPDLPDPVTGPFMIPVLDVSQQPRECIEDTSLSRSWDCKMPRQYYNMDIEEIDDAKDTAQYELTLSANSHDGTAAFIYGTQPPSILEPAALTLVNDTFALELGPAWWVKIEYNKTVIVNSADLIYSESKRDYTDTVYDPVLFSGAPDRALVGDMPWMCIWPDTTLEIFIYPARNGSAAASWPQKRFRRDDDDNDDEEEEEEEEVGEEEDDAFDGNVELPYPHVVKFLERRYNVNPKAKATCQQVYVRDDIGNFDLFYNEDGNLNIIDVEVDPDPWEGGLNKRDATQGFLLPRQATALELTDCGCLWRSD